MQDYILKTLHTELENTHNLLDHYKPAGLKERFFSLFGNSFKKVLKKYAGEKEDALMTYATLHYDIGKDIKGSQAKATEVEHIRIGITSMTHKIENCGKTLALLISHSHRQEEILTHEKKFFVTMLESFNSDLVEWVSAHEKEIFGEVSTIENNDMNNSLVSGKKLLEKQKQRLESHLKNISNS